MSNVICVQCRKVVDYNIKEIEQMTVIKKEEIVYKEKVAYCKNCGEEVWVEELEKWNVLEPINVYCKKKGLISPRQVQELLDRYNIGKRPLAELLDWGEITISRFLEGQLPTKTYSDKLLELYNCPDCFLTLLKRNKDKWTSVAFRKAYNAANLFLPEESCESIKLDREEYKYNVEKVGVVILAFNKYNRYRGEECKKTICNC